MRWNIGRKKLIILTIAIALAAVLIVGYIHVSEKPEEEPTKVGLASWPKGLEIIPQYVAQDRGYFEDEGLEVEITYFRASADAISAIVAGDLEFGLTSDVPLLKAIEAGVPIKAIGLIYYASKKEGHIGTAYTALNESGIKNVEDLRGKRIAIPYVGGDTHINIVALLKEHGINPDEDVTFVVVPWPFMIEALIKGEVDVVGLLPQHLTVMELEGINYTIVTSSVDLLPRIESLIIYASTDYIEENPDVVRRFLRAFYRGQAYVETRPEAYKRYLADYGGWDPQVLEKLSIKKLLGMPHGGRFNETVWQEFIKLMVDNGYLKEEISVDRVLTEEYLPALKDLE